MNRGEKDILISDMPSWILFLPTVMFMSGFYDTLKCIFYLFLEWNWTVLLHTSQNWKKIQSEAYYGDLPLLSWDYLRTLGWHSLRTLDGGSSGLPVSVASPRDARCPRSPGTQIVGWMAQVAVSILFKLKSAARIFCHSQGHTFGDLYSGVPRVSPQRFCHLMGIP